MSRLLTLALGRCPPVPFLSGRQIACWLAVCLWIVQRTLIGRRVTLSGSRQPTHFRLASSAHLLELLVLRWQHVGFCFIHLVVLIVGHIFFVLREHLSVQMLILTTCQCAKDDEGDWNTDE